MRAVLWTIFAASVGAAALFALGAITDADAMTRPGGEFKAIALQWDMILLGIAAISAAISGAGASALYWLQYAAEGINELVHASRTKQTLANTNHEPTRPSSSSPLSGGHYVNPKYTPGPRVAPPEAADPRNPTGRRPLIDGSWIG